MDISSADQRGGKPSSILARSLPAQKRSICSENSFVRTRGSSVSLFAGGVSGSEALRASLGPRRLRDRLDIKGPPQWSCIDDIGRSVGVPMILARVERSTRGPASVPK